MSTGGVGVIAAVLGPVVEVTAAAAAAAAVTAPPAGDVDSLGDGRLADGTTKPFYLKTGQTVSDDCDCSPLLLKSCQAPDCCTWRGCTTDSVGRGLLVVGAAGGWGCW
jgi:hypothetical protein